MELSLIQKIVIWVIPVLLAITLHEASHAYVAYKLGDPTAKLLGRVSFNPLKHIDPVGTIFTPIALGFITNFAFIFGWAKPVPITVENFKSKRRDTALVAAAGPISNLVMCFTWALILKLSHVFMQGSAVSPLKLFIILSANAGIIINLLLCLLNFFPIPPLDGSRIVSSLLPPRHAYYYDKLEPYGFFIIVALILTNVLGFLLTPPFNAMIRFIHQLFQL